MSINTGNQSSTINTVTEHVAQLQYENCDITFIGESRAVQQLVSTVLPNVRFERNQGPSGSATFVFVNDLYVGCINTLTVAEHQSSAWMQRNQGATTIRKAS